MNIKSKYNKSFLYAVGIGIFIIFILVMYGFYEKNEKVQLYKDFRANKKIRCADVIVQKSRGWSIRNNRFFTNGKTIKTIASCH